MMKRRAASRSSRLSQSAHRRPRLRPGLEWLEDRRLPASFLVTSAADSGAGTLRDAIAKANATQTADSITFQPGLGTITLTSNSLMITQDLTITGPAAKITVKRDQFQGRIFEVDSATVTLKNLIVSGGEAAWGAGLNNLGGTVTIDSSIFSGNTSVAFGRGGAAVYNDNGGVMTIDSSTFSGTRSYLTAAAAAAAAASTTRPAAR